jgi:nucleoside-diphosphate-sugar epimerase
MAGLDSGFFAHCLTNATIFPECRVDIQYFADVRDLPSPALGRMDAVVYLAAISNDPMGQKYEDVTLDVNYLAAARMAHQAKQAGARSFVYVSSCSVYGQAENGPRNEQSEVAPLTAYARSKALAEQALAGEADERFQVTCLRFGTACGMSPRLRLDLVLNDFVACAVADGRITVLSDGSPWRPLIHIKDMARAIDWAVCRKREHGGAFLVVNAGSNEWNFQVKDLAEAVARVVPGTSCSINRDALPDKRSYRVDFSLYQRLAPNHQPQQDLLATIRELREGLEAMGFRDRNFRDSNFIRLKVLSRLCDRGYLTPELRWTEKTFGFPALAAAPDSETRPASVICAPGA